MEISFYEEFPTKENLEKVKLIKFPTRLFVTAHSLKEFKELEKKIKKIKRNTEVAYWPIVKNSYWISPFSNRKDLTELFSELDKIKNHVLIDLEMPRKRGMILKNFFHFSENKKLIKDFMEKNKDRITTAEPIETIFSRYLQIRGQSFDIKTEKSLMWYSSMTPKGVNYLIKKRLPLLKNKEDYSISLGTIAIGILGNEPILSPKSLEKDLEFVKESGFKKVIIFRLGGLNEEYIKVIDRFRSLK